MSFSVRVVEDTASQLLKNISENLKAKTQQYILDVGQQMLEYTRSIVPVRTGYLQSTTFFIAKADLDFEFGATAPYALFVEMGTWKMAAQPFIRPAVEAYTTAILDAIVKAVMEACKG